MLRTGPKHIAAILGLIVLPAYAQVDARMDGNVQGTVAKHAAGTQTLGTLGVYRLVSVEADAPQSVYVTDIDGDGDVDMLSASSGDHKIAWYENLGGGVFSGQITISTDAKGAQHVYAADLDDDGDMDVLSASSDDNKIAWYENVQGDFSEQRVLSTDAQWAKAVHAADMDGDGDLDVLSASYGDDKIAWYENQGAGVFSRERIISTQADGARSVYTADLDGDGDMDVLSASKWDRKVAWYENVQGDFSEQRVLSTEFEAWSVYADDLDGDGDMDVLSAPHASWYENLGGNVFSERQSIATSKFESDRFISTVDMDKDGDMDVFSISYNYNDIYWYENDGSGNFSGHFNWINIYSGIMTTHPSDIDGDGDLDIIVNAPNEDLIVWKENLGNEMFDSTRDVDQRFSQEHIIYTSRRGGIYRGCNSVSAKDIDGDNDIDVVCAVGKSGVGLGRSILWLEKVNNDNLWIEHVIDMRYGFGLYLYVADLDGDGDQDFLSGSGENNNKIVWYENLGIGKFSDPRIVSEDVNSVRHLYAADLDGDGDLDVLSASSADKKVAWYENLGTGEFSDQRIIWEDTGEGEAGYVYAADLDGDGDLDVISSWGRDSRISWYENLGAGRFSTEYVIGRGYARSMQITDLDRDGDIDVVSAKYPGIVWYENAGDGNFPNTHIIDQAYHADRGVDRIRVSDLDNDGDMDLIAAMYTNDRGNGAAIFWYENTIPGIFSERRQIDGAVSPSIYSTDVDRDGDMDVLFSSSDGISWYENEMPLMSSQAARLTFSRPTSIVDEGKIVDYGVKLNNPPSQETIFITPYSEDTTIAVVSGDLVFNRDNWDMYQSVTITSIPDNDYLNEKVTIRHAWMSEGYKHSSIGSIQVKIIDRIRNSGFADSEIISQDKPVDFLYTADIDGDNDLDIISVDSEYHTFPNPARYPYDEETSLMWYENFGNASFSTSRIITTPVYRSYPADLDNDDDVDIVVFSANRVDGHSLAWHQNNGLGNFHDQHIISTNVGLIRNIYVSDVDSDGDMDVLSASFDNDKIAWYENKGTGLAFVEHVVSTKATGAQAVYAADLDIDGDMDIISAYGKSSPSGHWEGGGVAWYENNGRNEFSNERIITEELWGGVTSLYAIDMDGDGDKDIQFACFYGCAGIVWYENFGNGDFSETRIIWVPYQTGKESAFPADLDGDGDIDIISSHVSSHPHYSSAQFAWYENRGDGTISGRYHLPWPGGLVPKLVHAADIDDDGDMDVLFGRGNTIGWLENLIPHPSSPVNVGASLASGPPPAFALEQNYPNPFNPETAIVYILPETAHVSLIIYNVVGQEVRRLVDATQASGQQRILWDGKDASGSHVPSGVYYYRLSTETWSKTRPMVLLR